VDKKFWKPLVVGILDIAAGALILAILFFFVIGSITIRIAESGIFDFDLSTLLMIIPALAIASLAVTGGICAIRRKKWGWALAGSIAAALMPLPFGLAAIIVLVMSKSEYDTEHK